MAWRDEYKPASYRGVPFVFKSSDDERAQRNLVHEFPGRDIPYLEEMGNAPTTFTIEALVSGDDYLTKRNNLQAVCGRKGAGRLVHPFYGELLVKCDKIITRHDSAEMGLARFSLTFTIDGDSTPVQSSVDTTTRTLLTAQDVIEKQKTAFDKAFDYASLPYAKAQAVVALVRGALDDAAKARALVAQAAAFSQEVSNLRGAISTLVLETKDLALRFVDVITFGLLSETVSDIDTPDPRQSFAGLGGLLGYAPFVPAVSESSSAFMQLIQGAAIAQGAHLLSLISFDSVNEASELQTTLFDAIDSFLSIENLDDDLYLSTLALRADVERDVSERAITLPRLVDLMLPEFTPALVLSFRLYGDLDQEDAICRRNKLPNPGIVPAGLAIKIVTDV